MKAIVNGLVLTEQGPRTGLAVIFEQQISGLVPADDLPPGMEHVIDAEGMIVSPGLIDMHIHGCAGHDLMDGSLQALRRISVVLAEHGVTSFLPTTMCRPQSELEGVLGVVKQAAQEHLPGAQVLGAHLEGPFLNPEFRGAQAAEYLQLPTMHWLSSHLDVVRVLTFAPELELAENLQRELAKTKVVQSIGHSAATYEQAMAAIRHGITHAAHLFNAMSPLHHREPGVVGAVLQTEVTAELIADGMHVHPALYSMLRRLKGQDGIILISDAMRAAGLPDGKYDLGGTEVAVQAGVARNSDGKLAGSTMLLNQAVLNWQKHTDEGLAAAIRMASALPARVLGLITKGSIAPGKDADLVIFDQDMCAQRTFVGGRTVHSRSQRRKA